MRTFPGEAAVATHEQKPVHWLHASAGAPNPNDQLFDVRSFVRTFQTLGIRRPPLRPSVPEKDVLPPTPGPRKPTWCPCTFLVVFQFKNSFLNTTHKWFVLSEWEGQTKTDVGSFHWGSALQSGDAEIEKLNFSVCHRLWSECVCDFISLCTACKPLTHL